MGLECHDPSDPHEWLRRARSNFARASAEPTDPEILLEDLCFDAQQAAEKAVMAVPNTHAMADLFSLAANNGVEVPTNVSAAAGLTTYAVETRYPGVVESVSHEEWIEAVASANLVLRWAVAVIGPPGN